MGHRNFPGNFSPLPGFKERQLVCRGELRLMSRYIELHCRSAFSFLQGASLPEELAAGGAELGMPGVGLIDAEGVYGAPRLHTAAKKVGVRAFIGAEIPVRASSQFSALSSPLKNICQLPLLVESRAGYQNLCRL